MSILFHIPVIPCPAPRIVPSDRWETRPCVQKYRQFRDGVNDWISQNKISQDALPARITVIFYMPFPRSKGKKWRQKNLGEGHTFRPDTDNLIKAFLDAWFRDANSEDSHIWDVRGIKVWSNQGAIEVFEAEKLLMES